MDFILIVSPLNFWHQNFCVENKYQFFSNIRHIIDGTYFNQSHRTFFLTHTYTYLDVYRFFEKNGEEEEGVIDWNFWRVETAKKAFWAVTECENNQGKKHADYVYYLPTYLLLFLNNKEAAASYFSTAAAAWHLWPHRIHIRNSTSLTELLHMCIFPTSIIL